MKKSILFGVFAVILFGFAACNNVDEPKPGDGDGGGGDKDVKILLKESFGNAATAAPWPAVADYTGFKKEGIGAAAVTYTSQGGLVSIRSNQGSSDKDYTGASGECNAMAAAGGASLIINDIATCGAKDLLLSFGSIVVSDTLAVSYKINGTANWVNLPYTKTKSGWGLVENLEIKLPAGTNTIKLKFDAAKTQYGARIDDISLTTTDVTTAPVIDPDNTGGGEGNGNGSENSPYDVVGAIANQNGSHWVQGFIVGVVDGLSIKDNSSFTAPFISETNILIAATASETDYNKCLPIQLPAGAVRAGLNLATNGANKGKKVKFYGSLETYFGVSGVRSVSYFEIEGGATGGTKPVDTGGALLSETLLTQASYNKFTAVSVSGNQVWTFSSSYGAMISGFADNASHANEDWFISPAINLAGKSNVNLSFEHARGPAGSMSVPLTDFTLWVSNDYTSGLPSTATWTQVAITTHGTTAWGFVSSGNLAIPAANLKANMQFAFKYTCSDMQSATWEIKNVVLK